MRQFEGAGDFNMNYQTPPIFKWLIIIGGLAPTVGLFFYVWLDLPAIIEIVQKRIANGEPPLQGNMYLFIAIFFLFSIASVIYAVKKKTVALILMFLTGIFIAPFLFIFSLGSFFYINNYQRGLQYLLPFILTILALILANVDWIKSNTVRRRERL